MNNKEQNNIQCLSISQMDRLEKLGVDTSDATFAWVVDASENFTPILHMKKDVDNYINKDSVVYVAFGLMDILSLLPIKLECNCYSSGCGDTSMLGDFSFTIKSTSKISIDDHFDVVQVLHHAFNRIVKVERPLDVTYFVLEEFTEKGLIKKSFSVQGLHREKSNVF